MAPRNRANSPPPKRSRAQRARQYLTSGAVSREDSDDELGLVDYEWEWIYDDEPSAKGANAIILDASEGNPQADTPSRKKNPKAKRIICGARMGSFECRVGDTVLLKSPEAGKAWIGIILYFLEDEDEGKAASFMWFSADAEIKEKHKRKRNDVLPQELYLTPAYDTNGLAAINGKATVCSKENFEHRFPKGQPSPQNRKELAEFNKWFICRRACNTRTVTYTDEFLWEEYFPSGKDMAISDLLELVDRVTDDTKLRKRKAEKLDIDFLGDESSKDPSTPRKRQKTTSATPTPKKRHSTLTTPTHKRIIVKKALEFTPLGTRILSPSATSSPYSIARSTLHVASVPSSLPCRENEFTTVHSHLSAAIADGTGACIYISGVPGTGKTATVREVICSLHASVLEDDLEPFNYVEINGMKVTDPHQSYSLLWEALHGDRVSPSHALSLLQQEFTTPSPNRVPCVVLMDELDQLVTRNQSVMYNFFNWPALRHSRLIVLAVANTMDLPERTLSNKISSRLGLTRITFPGYSHSQLQKIIISRLEQVPGNIVDSDAIQFAARKVAAVSGDARRCLDICRRAVEIAEQQSQNQNQESGKSTHVTIPTIKLAISESVSSPLYTHLRSLPLIHKLFLAALLGRTRRIGLAECTLGDVLEEAKKIAVLADNPHVSDFLQPVGVKGVKVARVAGLGNAAVQLMEAGIVVLETKKGERVGRVRLEVGVEDVKGALGNDGEVKGMGLNS